MHCGEAREIAESECDHRLQTRGNVKPYLAYRPKNYMLDTEIRVIRAAVTCLMTEYMRGTRHRRLRALGVGGGGLTGAHLKLVHNLLYLRHLLSEILSLLAIFTASHSPLQSERAVECRVLYLFGFK